jgi:hypothetical protein
LEYLTTHTSLSPIRRGFAHGFVNYKKACTRLAAASDKVYQLLAHGRWFSPCTPASSTTKTGRHNIAEILLKVELNTKNQSINYLNLNCTCGVYSLMPRDEKIYTKRELKFKCFMHFVSKTYILQTNIQNVLHTFFVDTYILFNK